MKSDLRGKEFLAKGNRGLVYKAIWNGKKVAVKEKNPESQAHNRLENEANSLQILNPHGIGPKLFHFDGQRLILEYIEGERILDYFKTHSSKEIQALVQKILKQLQKLDELGINKYELTHPYKDLLIRNGKPVLLDFERCKKTIRPKNVRQFEQFLRSKKVRALLLPQMISAQSFTPSTRSCIK